MFCSSVKSVPAVLDDQALIGATTWSWPGAVLALQPVAVIDARMRKPATATIFKARAPDGPMTIGIGPGFVAGSTVSTAIESSWGERMGALVTCGPTFGPSRASHERGRAGRERFVHAPRADRFATGQRIGERVARRPSSRRSRQHCHRGAARRRLTRARGEWRARPGRGQDRRSRSTGRACAVLRSR